MSPHPQPQAHGMMEGMVHQGKCRSVPRRMWAMCRPSNASKHLSPLKLQIVWSAPSFLLRPLMGWSPSSPHCKGIHSDLVIHSLSSHGAIRLSKRLDSELSGGLCLISLCSMTPALGTSCLHLLSVKPVLRE